VSARGLLSAALLALSACGGEATTTGPTDASTQPAKTVAKPVQTSTQVVASGAPSSTAPAQAGLEPSQANVGKLLEGGQALKSLPSRPVDSGKGFDPELRSKLAPQSPAKNP
jgi:hypothetical protein